MQSTLTGMWCLQAHQQPAAQGGLDLLDLLGEGGGATATSSPAAASAASSDLFGGGGGGASTAHPAAAAPGHRPQPSTELDDLFGAPAAAAAAPQQPQFPPITAWEKDGLQVGFEFAKPAGAPGATDITATYTNSGADTVSDFTLQVGLVHGLPTVCRCRHAAAPTMAASTAALGCRLGVKLHHDTLLASTQGSGSHAV